MDIPGLTLSPIIDMTTAHSFNQTFFDDVRLPAKYLVGQEGDGWRLQSLANERRCHQPARCGLKPSADDLLNLGAATEVAMTRSASTHRRLAH